MSRNDIIALAVLGMALAAIVSVCWLSSGSSVAIDQGWATLLAALLGFGAIAYQTKAGFRNLKASSVEQAKADRAAREHQADLERAAYLDAQRQSVRSLAAALAAELLTCSERVRSLLPGLLIQKVSYEAVGEDVVPRMIPGRSLASFDLLIYRSNAARLGELGPSLAHDVVGVFNVLSLESGEPLENVKGRDVAVVLGAYASAYEKWLLDQKHVYARLMAKFHQLPDPGDLNEDRARRPATGSRANPFSSLVRFE